MSATEIHSCLIKNNTDAEINIQVEFAGVEDHHREIADVKLAQGEEQRLDEKEFDDEKSLKTIEWIRVRKFDGSTMELKKPFPAKKFVVFDVQNDSIRAGGEK